MRSQAKSLSSIMLAFSIIFLSSELLLAKKPTVRQASAQAGAKASTKVNSKNATTAQTKKPRFNHFAHYPRLMHLPKSLVREYFKFNLHFAAELETKLKKSRSTSSLDLLFPKAWADENDATMLSCVNNLETYLCPSNDPSTWDKEPDISYLTPELQQKIKDRCWTEGKKFCALTGAGLDRDGNPFCARNSGKACVDASEAGIEWQTRVWEQCRDSSDDTSALLNEATTIGCSAYFTKQSEQAAAMIDFCDQPWVAHWKTCLAAKPRYEQLQHMGEISFLVESRQESRLI